MDLFTFQDKYGKELGVQILRVNYMFTLVKSFSNVELLKSFLNYVIHSFLMPWNIHCSWLNQLMKSLELQRPDCDR